MKIKYIIDGFKFGMLLQIAIGPVCLYIFNEANNNGFLSAEIAVFAVITMDLIFVLCAITGITSFLKNERRKQILKYFGACILLLFGTDLILGQFNYTVLPSYTIFYLPSNSFVKGLLLTGSNPLTIVFWSGIFSIKVNQECYNKNDTYYFGYGAVLATLTFLTFIAIVGVFLSKLLSNSIIKILNIAVGVVFIFFSVRLIFRRNVDKDIISQ